MGQRWHREKQQQSAVVQVSHFATRGSSSSVLRLLSRPELIAPPPGLFAAKERCFCQRLLCVLEWCFFSFCSGDIHSHVFTLLDFPIFFSIYVQMFNSLKDIDKERVQCPSHHPSQLLEESSSIVLWKKWVRGPLFEPKTRLRKPGMINFKENPSETNKSMKKLEWNEQIKQNPCLFYPYAFMPSSLLPCNCKVHLYILLIVCFIKLHHVNPSVTGSRL